MIIILIDDSIPEDVAIGNKMLVSQSSHDWSRIKELPVVVKDFVYMEDVVRRYDNIFKHSNGVVCYVLKKCNFINVFGECYVLYNLSFITSQPVFSLIPFIRKDPSPSFMANFRSCLIDGDGNVRFQQTSTDVDKTKPYAYTWVNSSDQPIVGKIINNTTLILDGCEHTYCAVAHRYSIHNYSAPVFFKPSHDEIALQFSDVIPDGIDEEFYVNTTIAPCEFVSDYHVGVTIVFKRKKIL